MDRESVMLGTSSSSYILYGSYASYYTAKVRAYLRKKQIPFAERLPSDPAFRDQVRPSSGSHRIPQLVTPDGQVIQDSVEIMDHLEARFPELPAIPQTPRQRTFVHLMELLGSEGLLRLAWLHRWMFAQNDQFVKMDFGRSFRPQGNDRELLKYGNLIAERMRSYGLPETSAALRTTLDNQYRELLALFEVHWMQHPYLLGGQPSAADYAVMGALHAHLGRDPAGLSLMQQHAPRTFRWVEHMQVPEIPAPEFFDRSVGFLDDDEVPKSALAITHWIAENYGKPFVLGGLGFNQALGERHAQAGYEIDPTTDQPTLGLQTVSYRGSEHQHSSNVHAVWIAQRVQAFVQAQPKAVQTDIVGWLGAGVAQELIQVPLRFVLARVNNRLVVT